MWITRVAVLILTLTFAGTARADVVINEIFFHAPDDLDNVQFIELHNTGAEAVDLAGWKLAKGIKFTFPAKASIEAGGYLVVCKNLQEFKTYYKFDAAGEFAGSLSHSSDQVELVDAGGKKIDGVKYKTRAPWAWRPRVFFVAGADLSHGCGDGARELGAVADGGRHAEAGGDAGEEERKLCARGCRR